MKRHLLAALLAWKAQSQRKPVLIDGARQVGKSYLIEHLFAPEFNQLIKLNFLEDPDAAALFEGRLTADTLLENIELYLGVSVNPETDLLFFDEIGECPKAVDALKFFCEQRPDLYLCASGSNIGLLDSFPVGKVYQLELYPMCFEEFLEASGDVRLLQRFRNLDRSQLTHNLLFELFLDYYFVGGMPEAVKAWFTQASKLKKVERVTHIHNDLLEGYMRDFGKYGGKTNAMHIEMVFRNVPTQLSSNIDGSVKRYRFSNVIPHKKRYLDLFGPINWLEKAKLVSKCYPINCQPKAPLDAYAKDNRFKLFFFDIGLLNYMLGLSYQELMHQTFEYKGYIAENFVQNELRIGRYPTYAWEENTAEIEFLYKTGTAEIVPVEVKSGKQTKAKSLKSFCERYSPSKTVKLMGSVGSGEQEREHMALPLYYASKLSLFLEPQSAEEGER